MNCNEEQEVTKGFGKHKWEGPDMYMRDDGVMIYGYACDTCWTTKYATYKTVKKKKSKRLFKKKTLRKYRKWGYKVKFSSSNKKVLKINKKTGKMKGKKKGYAIVTVKYKGHGYSFKEKYKIVVK